MKEAREHQPLQHLTNGIATDFLQCTCSGEEYFDFLCGNLIAQMLPFDGLKSKFHSNNGQLLNPPYR